MILGVQEGEFAVEIPVNLADKLSVTFSLWFTGTVRNDFLTDVTARWQASQKRTNFARRKILCRFDR